MARKCLAPNCFNSSDYQPFKLFFFIKKGDKRRRAWLKALDLDFNSFPTTKIIYVCEDHFNLEDDLENYVRYKYGSVRRHYLKDTVVPHIFDSKKKCESIPSIKERKELVESLIHEYELSNAKPKIEYEVGDNDEWDEFGMDKGMFGMEPTEVMLSEDPLFNVSLEYPVKEESVFNIRFEENEHLEMKIEEELDQKMHSPEGYSGEFQDECAKISDSANESSVTIIDKYTCALCRCSSFSFESYTKHSCFEETLSKKRKAIVNESFFKNMNCPFCYLHFDDHYNFKSHVINSHSVSWMFCPYCEFCSLYNRNVKSHMSYMHGKKARLFMDEKPLAEIGTEIPHAISQISCPHCNYKDCSETKINHHIETKHKKFTCALCHFTVLSRRLLVNHIFTVHSCNFQQFSCGKTNSTRRKRKQVLKSRQFFYRCPICQLDVEQFKAFRDHVTSHHTGGKDLFCNYCDFYSWNSRKLSKHIKHQHPLKSLTCRHCGFTTFETYRMLGHLESECRIR